MPLFRRRKSQPAPPPPPVPVALWAAAPRMRPLKPGEQIAEGATVYVDEQAHTFSQWMHCGKDRYALLDGAQEFRVAHESRLRLMMEG